MNFKLAIKSDIDRITELILQAKDYLKDQGIDQWQKEYPNKDSVISDIESGYGYVLTYENKIIGYACISFDEEECYKEIKGQWKSIQPYAVIHRMTIDNAYKGQGLSAKILSFAERLCMLKSIHSIKIDTDNDNETMKHILEKNGYEYCGIVRFDNSDKIAYEKII